MTDEKGKPAKAQLMATMYDISLDAIYPHEWDLDVNLNKFVASLSWDGTIFGNRSLYGEMPIKYLNQNDLDLTHLIDLYLDDIDAGYSGLGSLNIKWPKALQDRNVSAIRYDIATKANEISLFESKSTSQSKNISSITTKKDIVRENLN